jgi:elongation factor Ts
MATTTIAAKEVQQLRTRTGAGMMDCKQALEEAHGDLEKAIELLRKRGAAKAEKRIGKTAREGLVSSYIHHNGRVGVLVEVNCETDFVARSAEFHAVVRHIAEQIAATAPIAVDKDMVPAERVDQERRVFLSQVEGSGKPAAVLEKIVSGKLEAFYRDVALMHQAWVREPKRTIGDLVAELSAKVGERIVIARFTRYQLGDE